MKWYRLMFIVFATIVMALIFYSRWILKHSHTDEGTLGLVYIVSYLEYGIPYIAGILFINMLVGICLKSKNQIITISELLLICVFMCIPVLN